MITIPPKETYFLKVELYQHHQFIGIIETKDQYWEICAQIYESGKRGEDSSGYYMIFNDEKIELNEIARHKKAPTGFFTHTRECLKRLIAK